MFGRLCGDEESAGRQWAKGARNMRSREMTRSHERAKSHRTRLTAHERRLLADGAVFAAYLRSPVQITEPQPAAEVWQCYSARVARMGIDDDTAPATLDDAAVWFMNV